MTHVDLQYFYQGPLHNTLVTAHELLHGVSSPHITEYRWTSGLLTGQSGRQARIWAHTEVSPEVLSDFMTSATS